jgi:DNA-binding transcriptional LysR family regulator
MIPSSSDIAYFIEAASKLNFSRAAESLGISQPSLSMAIRRVEDGIGRALFIRSKRGVTLTQAGKHLLSQAHNLLDAWQNIRYKAVAAESSMEGRYVIGCHSSVALYSLPSFLPKLLKEHARIQLELVHDLSRRIVEGVVTSRIDLLTQILLSSSWQKTKSHFGRAFQTNRLTASRMMVPLFAHKIFCKHSIY